MEIVSGVHQLRIPFPEGMERQTNAYVIEGLKGNILVDCGWDSSEAVWAFREELRVDRLAFEDINWIVITHLHPDHYGLASKLRDLCSAKVIMHRGDAELIDSRYVHADGLADETERMLVVAGTPPEEASEMREASMWARRFVTPVVPDVVVDTGDTVSNGTFQFEVVHTPGHSPGHLGLYDPRKRRFFCGDHVLFDVAPHVGIDPQSGNDPAGEYIESLRELSDMPVSFVFPGHGPVFNSLSIRAEEILRQHGARKLQILSTLEEGLMTPYEVTVELGWRLDGQDVEYGDLPFRDRRAAVCEVLAWLKRLAIEGKVAPLDRDGKTVYLAK